MISKKSAKKKTETDDRKTRMEVEKTVLDDNLKRLVVFVIDSKFDELSSEAKVKLVTQGLFMFGYSKVLASRIKDVDKD